MDFKTAALGSILGAVLGVAPRTVVDLNLQTRNTRPSELGAGPQLPQGRVAGLEGWGHPGARRGA